LLENRHISKKHFVKTNQTLPFIIL